MDKVKDFDQARHLFLMVKRVDEQDPNIVHSTVSTDEIDRYGEIVQPGAFKEALSSFLLNPVVLPAHQHRLENGEPPVIGNVLINSIVISEHLVDMDILFDDDDLGQKYARKYQKKMMRAFSIGFRGLEGEYREEEGKRVWIWTKLELLEVSAVAVPANRGALARALGYYEQGDPAETVRTVVNEATSQLRKDILDLTSAMEDSLEEIKTLLTPDQDGLARRLMLGGDAGDRSDPAGDKIAERIVSDLANINTALGD